LRLALDVRNLFDVRVATYEGATGPVHEPIGDYYEFPLPGRTLLVSARFAQPGDVP
jgi:outer membrane receptor protein involved in Fe transport